MVEFLGMRLRFCRDLNSFFTTVTKRDGMLETYMLIDGEERQVSTNRDERYMVNHKVNVRFRLSEKGSREINELVGRCGPMVFCFYRDDQNPNLDSGGQDVIKATVPQQEVVLGRVVRIDWRAEQRR